MDLVPSSGQGGRKGGDLGSSGPHPSPEEAESAPVGGHCPLPPLNKSTRGHHQKLGPASFTHVQCAGLPLLPLTPSTLLPSRLGAVHIGLGVWRGERAGQVAPASISSPGSHLRAPWPCGPSRGSWPCCYADASWGSAGGFSLLGTRLPFCSFIHSGSLTGLCRPSPTPKLNPYLFGAPTLGPRSSARWGSGRSWQSGLCNACAWQPGSWVLGASSWGRRGRTGSA